MIKKGKMKKKTLIINLLKDIACSRKKNFNYDMVLIFIQNNNISLIINNILNKLTKNLFSYIFVITMDNPEVDIQKITDNINNLVPKEKVKGINCVNLKKQTGIDQVCKSLVDYYSQFQIKMQYNFITTENRIIFDKNYDISQIYTNIINILSDIIISIINDVNPTTPSQKVLKDFNKLFEVLANFMILISNLLGEDMAIKKGIYIITKEWTELLAQEMDQLITTINFNVCHLNWIIDDFKDNLNQALDFDINQVINNNILICISYCYMTHFLYKIISEFHSAIFVYESEEVIGLTKGVLCLEKMEKKFSK